MLVNEPGSAGFGQISWNADIEDVRKSQTCWDHVCWGGVFLFTSKKNGCVKGDVKGLLVSRFFTTTFSSKLPFFFWWKLTRQWQSSLTFFKIMGTQLASVDVVTCNAVLTGISQVPRGGFGMVDR